MNYLENVPFELLKVNWNDATVIDRTRLDSMNHASFQLIYFSHLAIHRRICRLIYASNVASTNSGFPRGLCFFAIPEGTRPATFCSSALGTRYFKSDPKRSSLLSPSPLLFLLRETRQRRIVNVRRFKNNRHSYEETVFINGPCRSRNNFPQVLVPVWRFFVACRIPCL